MFDCRVHLNTGKFIGNKWMCQVKNLTNVSVEWYEERLVAKIFSHRVETDFWEIYAPAIKFKKLLLAVKIVEKRQLRVFQIDVRSGSLNVELQDEV